MRFVRLLPSISSDAQSFVEELKKQKVIDKAIFTVRFVDAEYGSEITFGGFNQKIVQNMDNFTFTPLYDNRYWSVGIRKIRYGEVEIGGRASWGIIDTGSPMLLLPYEDYNRWFEEATKGKSCGDYKTFKGWYCLNVNDFRDIFILFNNYEYRITANHYVEKTMYNNKMFCYFLVGKAQNSSIPSAILGDVFIRGYYILHDLDEERIGIYGSYMKFYPTEITMRSRLIMSWVLLVIIVFSVILYFYKKEKIRKKESELEKLLSGGVEIED